MSRPRSILEERLAGLQLAVFEIVWPAFPWIRSLWIRQVNRRIEIFVEMASALADEEREDCLRLVKEMLDVAMPGLGHAVAFGAKVPQGEDCLELMSDRLFQQIAKEVAPWRLRGGR